MRSMAETPYPSFSRVSHRRVSRCFVNLSSAALCAAETGGAGGGGASAGINRTVTRSGLAGNTGTAAGRKPSFLANTNPAVSRNPTRVKVPSAAVFAAVRSGPSTWNTSAPATGRPSSPTTVPATVRFARVSLMTGNSRTRPASPNTSFASPSAYPAAFTCTPYRSFGQYPPNAYRPSASVGLVSTCRRVPYWACRPTPWMLCNRLTLAPATGLPAVSVTRPVSPAAFASPISILSGPVVLDRSNVCGTFTALPSRTRGAIASSGGRLLRVNLPSLSDTTLPARGESKDSAI
jgi:hypothetical protein